MSKTAHPIVYPSVCLQVTSVKCRLKPMFRFSYKLLKTLQLFRLFFTSIVISHSCYSVTAMTAGAPWNHHICIPTVDTSCLCNQVYFNTSIDHNRNGVLILPQNRTTHQSCFFSSFCFQIYWVDVKFPSLQEP